MLLYIESFKLTMNCFSAKTMSWTSVCHVPGLTGILPPLIIKIVKIHNNIQILFHTILFIQDGMETPVIMFNIQMYFLHYH